MKYEGREVWEEDLLGFGGISAIWLAVVVWVSGWMIERDVGGWVTCSPSDGPTAQCYASSVQTFLGPDPARIPWIIVLFGIYLIICAIFVSYTEVWE